MTRCGLWPLAEVEVRRNEVAELLVIASSGGHLAQALAAMPKDATFHVFTNRAGVATDDDRIVTLTVPRYDTHRNPLIHVVNIATAVYVIRRHRIRLLFSTGGSVALPFAVVARIMRYPFVFMDTLSRVEDLSNTARLVTRLRLVPTVLSQWPEVAARYPGVRYAGAIAPVCRYRH
jgi:beta-1,4-N-acetylglucosaminyltransferase